MSFAKKQTLPFKRIRIIPFAKYSGSQNMALDHLLATTMPNDGIPVLRFYGWEPFCLSLGRHQDSNKINGNALKGDGYELVRRPTGGSAVLHAHELTYSFIAPLKKIDHHQIFSLLHRILADALNNLNYEVVLEGDSISGNYLKEGEKSFACFNRSAQFEIQFKGKKLVGSAQRIYHNVVLQHGSILLDSTQNRIVKYFKANEPNLKQMGTQLHNHAIALKDIRSAGITELKIQESIVDILEKKWKISVFFQYPTKNELTNSKKFLNHFAVQLNSD